MGIEPTQLAWKARILPLNYTRVFHFDRLNSIQHFIRLVNSCAEVFCRVCCAGRAQFLCSSRRIGVRYAAYNL